MLMIYVQDRLLHNPWAEPPSSKDWDIQPTYPRHDPMPYYLAPLWDVHYAKKADHHSAKKHAKSAGEKHRVPKELRLKLKRARAARGMLQDLEDEIRLFIRKWNEKQLLIRSEGLQDAPESSASDDSEDEIVFVGRAGQMHDAPERKRRLQQLREEMSSHHEKDGEKMVFESMVDDRAAGFGYVACLIAVSEPALTIPQSLACALDRLLLWSAYLVGYCRGPCATGSLCGIPPPSEPSRACHPSGLSCTRGDPAGRGAPSASLCTGLGWRVSRIHIGSLSIFIGVISQIHLHKYTSTSS